MHFLLPLSVLGAIFAALGSSSSPSGHAGLASGTTSLGPAAPQARLQAVLALLTPAAWPPLLPHSLTVQF